MTLCSAVTCSAYSLSHPSKTIQLPRPFGFFIRPAIMSLYLSPSTSTRFIPYAWLPCLLIFDSLKCDSIGLLEPLTGSAHSEFRAQKSYVLSASYPESIRHNATISWSPSSVKYGVFMICSMSWKDNAWPCAMFWLVM